MSRNTLISGTAELAGGAGPSERVRRSGGGRKKAIDLDPDLLVVLDSLVEPESRGDPMSPLRWTAKSLRNLSGELARLGHKAGPDLVGDLLHYMRYSLQGNAKVTEGAQNPDRNAQFEYINTTAGDLARPDTGNEHAITSENVQLNAQSRDHRPPRLDQSPPRRPHPSRERLGLSVMHLLPPGSHELLEACYKSFHCSTGSIMQIWQLAEAGSSPQHVLASRRRGLRLVAGVDPQQMDEDVDEAPCPQEWSAHRSCSGPSRPTPQASTRCAS